MQSLLAVPYSLASLVALFAHVPLDFFGREETLPDTVKLARAELKLKAELKPVIARDLSALLKAL